MPPKYPNRAPVRPAAIGSLLLLAAWPAEGGIIQGWSPTARGSIRNMGNSGAHTTIGSDVATLAENPAAAALSAQSVNLQVGAQFTKDIQASGGLSSFVRQPFAGLVLPFEKWAIGALVSSAGSGDLSSGAGSAQYLLREARFVFAARPLREERLSLGAAIVLPTRAFYVGDSGSALQSDTQISVDFGAIIRLPKRLFLGTSFHSGYEFGPLTHPTLLGLLPASHQGRLAAPARAEFGMGWILNRFLRVGSSLTWMAPRAEFQNFRGEATRLSLRAGYRWAVGTEVQWLETEQVFSRVSLGTYLEPSATVNARSAFRQHWTASFELEYGIAQLAGSFDTASGFTAYGVSVGVEIGRLAHRLKVIPPSLLAPPAGFLPPETFQPSDDWLPTQLQDAPEKALQTIDPDFNTLRNYLPKALEKLPEHLDDEFLPDL
jgi:hypothetical protein